jgi:hypothetical protein
VLLSGGVSPQLGDESTNWSRKSCVAFFRTGSGVFCFVIAGLSRQCRGRLQVSGFSLQGAGC